MKDTVQSHLIESKLSGQRSSWRWTMWVIITGLVCALILASLTGVIRHQVRSKQHEEQRKMAAHVRRDVNSTAGWKEYQ